ncbi:MAG: hypothetical protein ABI193_23280 [Minicystis sp.]
MLRQIFEGFSLTLPEGWFDVLDDATYAEHDELPPFRFAAPQGPGALLVSCADFHPDDRGHAETSVVLALAHEWGERRGLGQPLSQRSETRDDIALATAVYDVRGDFVELWFLTNGRALVQASYVCPWADREDERAPREAIMASLRFA